MRDFGYKIVYLRGKVINLGSNKMPRANRHYIPGLIWHITDRCHKEEFLLKFARDRKRWLHWLYQAKKKYGLCVLNYTATSNHIHFLVFDKGKVNVIPNSVHLAAGRTAQEYNDRKGRRGAFWGDRYNATAVESDSHLLRCMIYIDLNMVRAGVVNHPKDWTHCGYNEIISQRQRYRLLDRDQLIKLLNLNTQNELREFYETSISTVIESNNLKRESMWTESLAVGSKIFVEQISKRLGYKARGRKLIEHKGTFELRQKRSPYRNHFTMKIETLRKK
ncbi:MAG: transposase [Candidatus Aminicenantaceae bacterium]|jgi:putative transposase